MNLQEITAEIERLTKLKKEANLFIEDTFRKDLKISEVSKVRNIDTRELFSC